MRMSVETIKKNMQKFVTISAFYCDDGSYVTSWAKGVLTDGSSCWYNVNRNGEICGNAMSSEELAWRLSSLCHVVGWRFDFNNHSAC